MTIGVPKVLLVTGSRRWRDSRKVELYLAFILRLWGDPKDAVLISGNANGADSLAERYWEGRGLEVRRFPVSPLQWKTIGRKAGPLRNRKMVAERPDLCLAFLDSQSRGTRDCVRACREAGIDVIEVFSD